MIFIKTADQVYSIKNMWRKEYGLYSTFLQCIEVLTLSRMFKWNNPSQQNQLCIENETTL